MVEQSIEVQQKLEQRLEKIWAAGVSDDSQVKDVFGTPEDWQFSLGEFKLMLDPIERKWFYQDGLHPVWQPTGVGCGEAVFGTTGSVLGWKSFNQEPDQPTGASDPPRAARKFCHECGGKLVSGAKFCSFCGAGIPKQGGG